jgi:Na+/melibiose symporter-like transporter
VSLAAFRVRSFRFQWPADLLTSWASEMEVIILGWYVVAQTGSVLWVTAFGSLQFFGTLGAPMFGVLGDRLGARAMLCAMRAIYAALAALLMLLALADLLTPAWVLAVAALAGLVRPNDLIMRNTLVGETIPARHLVGALGLSRSTMDSARVTGALAGAGLSTALGIGAAYVFVTVFYLASLALTLGVSRGRLVPDPAAGPQRGATVMAPPSRWRDLKDGLRHVLTTPTLFAVMWLAFLINLTAYPVSGGLLPYVARNVYRVDAAGLGWLAASFSFGALLASIATVLTGGARRPERTMLIGVAAWYVLLLGFAQMGHLPGGMLLLFLAGFAQSVGMISMTATLLAAAGDRFRARVMGVRTLAVYGLPVGLMVSGLLIERAGYRLTVTAACALGLACTVLIGARWRASLWHWRPAPQRAGSM